MISRICAAAAVAVVLLATQAAGAEDAFYYGKWKITDAVVAPWVKVGETPDPSESLTLVGQTITLSAAGIEGPGAFPCQSPKYTVIEGGPEMLFQGAFGQMHDENAVNDPQRLAQQVGFAGEQYRTVITGCEYAVDFSFAADNNAAKFGLNNYVYTMKRL